MGCLRCGQLDPATLKQDRQFSLPQTKPVSKLDLHREGVRGAIPTSAETKQLKDMTMKPVKTDLQTDKNCWDKEVFEMMGIPTDQLPIGEFELPPTLMISFSNRETESVFKARDMPLLDALLKLMDHGVGGKKGSCFSPFQFQNDRRSSENALSCHLGVIDCDRGDTSSDIASACIRHGFAALIVSTHSSGATNLEVKKVNGTVSGRNTRKVVQNNSYK